MEDPLDGGCDKAVVQQGLLDKIKEEPDDVQEYGPQESELKISAVFSATETSLGFQLGLPSSDPNTSFPSVPAAPVFCSGCKTALPKGQTTYRKAGSAQLFCSMGCISRYSSAVYFPPLPKRTCKHCFKDILNPLDVIPTQFENSSLCKDFCSQACLSSYELKRPVVTIYTSSISTKCSMCQKCTDNLSNKPLYALGTSPMLSAEVIKTTNDPGRTQLFCSINCLSAYRIRTVISSGLQVLCHSCKTAAAPQYHLAMSNGTICSFCSSNCVLAFQNVFNKPKRRTSSLVPISEGQEVMRMPLQSAVSAGKGAPASSSSSPSSCPPAALETPAELSRHTALAHSGMKLKCQQCNLLFATKPELLFYKGRMFLFCGKACSDEYKRRNKVKALCDYCKLQKIIKDVVRFSGVDKPFCSEVCKVLSTRDFGERWGKYCKMCSYCLQTSANWVENQLEGKVQVFCCEDCMSKFTALFYQTARCDLCNQQGKLNESLKWRGNIKYFCNLFCVLKFCHQYSMKDPIQQKKVFVLPKSASVIIPKAQTVLKTLPSPRIATTPVITSVMSLAKIPALQPTNHVLTESGPKEATEIIGNGSAQATAEELESSELPKLLKKNKGVLCKPATQTKATSCRPCTHHAACQTDLPLPNGKNEEPDSPPAKKKRIGFFQTYDAEYIKFGFIICSGSKESSPRLQCVICGEILPSESVMPVSLSNHLKAKHSELEKKPVDFFEEKSFEMECQNSSLKNCLLVEESLVKASYLIAFQIAARKKPFSIAEELIKPYLVEMCSEVLGSSAGDKMKTIPLSNNTIGCRINKLSADIEDQLVQKVRESKWFALQVDESSETSDVPLLLCYVRFIDYDHGDVKEELLFCTEMSSPSTDLEVFELINKYFESRSLNWNHCVGFCTDGAASMTDRCSRLRSKIQEITKNTVTFTHCFIHRERLADKKLSPCLHEMLLQSAQILSFVKSSASDSRMLTVLCEEAGSEHISLPLNAEVCWLSRGRILTRLFELRHEIEIFLNQKHSELARYLRDEEWVAKLAYLADIFSLINTLNSGLQGTMTTFFNLYKKVEIFKKKLKTWLKRTQEGDYDMFPLLSEFLDSPDVSVKNITCVVFEHLEGLSQLFRDCYPPEKDLRSGNLWIVNPFASNQNNSLTDCEEEKLAALSSDRRLQSAYKSMSVTQFWVNVKTSYPELHEKAVRLLLQFSTVCLCDATFSALTASKQRNLLSFGPALRLAVTSLAPRIEKLVKEKE